MARLHGMEMNKMMTLKLALNTACPFVHEAAARAFVQLLSRYECSIMLHDDNRTINAKSLLGILSLGYLHQSSLEVQLDGADEAQAAQAVQDYFAAL